MKCFWTVFLALSFSLQGCGQFKSHKEIFSESAAKGESISFAVEAPYGEVENAVVSNLGSKGYTRHVYIDEAEGFIVLMKNSEARMTLRDQGRMTHTVMVKFTDTGGGMTHVEMVNRAVKPLARMEVENDMQSIREKFDRFFPAEGIRE